MRIDIDKVKTIEKLIIQVGRELTSKAVMFKDDVDNVKNLEKCLANILTIQKREMKHKKEIEDE